VRVFISLSLLSIFAVCFVVALLVSVPVPAQGWISNPVASFQLAQGENPAPVTLLRPVAQPLSAMAQLGKALFYDPSLSSSGRLDCASCHNPAHAYGPAGDAPAEYGGLTLSAQGVRAVPSLMYLDAQPNFTIGPDPAGDSDAPAPLPQLAARASGAVRVTKTAQDTSQTSANIVPAGGLFWDGRANTLQNQAMGPLLSPFEMDGGSIQRVATKLQAAPYADRFTQLFGPNVFNAPNLLVSEALFAIARYQIEDPSFHLYNSRYDFWLEGKARLSLAEMRGYVLFNDPAKGDCAACHLDQPSLDGRPPLFTDHQYEALGAPRNPKLLVNNASNYYDLGICGPYRADLVTQTQFCGMFLTPTLRNAAIRHVYFHNGVYQTLQQVMDFYDYRDTNPEKIYPLAADGQAVKYNDLPRRYLANIDTIDPPLDRHLREAPALTAGEEKDIIAFLQTLTDGYALPGNSPGT
jgi:cytochrome c peroxidase